MHGSIKPKFYGEAMLKQIKFAIFYSLQLMLSLTIEPAFGSEKTFLEYPQLYHTAEPQRLRQTFEDAIINAEKSILIFTFSFSDLDLIQLLNQKAEQGVNILVIIDKDHRDPLLNYGSDKLQVITRFHGEGRVHHKILVIDEQHVWLGSANFSTSAFTSQENFVISVKSAEFAKALRYEADVFQGYQKRIDGPTPLEIFGDQKVSLYLLPNSDPHHNGPEKNMNEKGKQELLSLIENAQFRIRIAMMVWTDPELERAVLNAHERGVLVEILLQDMQDTVSWNLKRAGVFVTTNPHLNFMHNKLMWIDETILVNGSANWSRSSFSRNDESFLVLKNLDEIQHFYLEDYWTDLLTR
jgi:cardiolipin synthase A/B